MLDLAALVFDCVFYFLAFFSAFVVVIVSVPIVRVLAIRCGHVDIPSARKVHQIPIVRLGGVSIFLGTLVAAICLWRLDGFSHLLLVDQREILIILLGGSGYFLLGFFDDLQELSPGFRLVCQLAIAALVWQNGVRIDALNVPGLGLVHLGILSLPITLLWIAGLVNAINWIDGLDGLASGVSAISTLITAGICLFIGEPSVALLAMCLVGSLCGFLLYNFNPACIFMGDGGSYF
ncbi:MAG: MraY family glycosyltransferase, partial [Cyanobacteria bacterium P01_F01_bin.116]